MKRFMIIIALTVTLFISRSVSNTLCAQSTYVIVHGAWGGGWAFQTVDSLLDQSGHKVYRPTLTGQGERVHLASKDIGLNTHILDIVNTILYEDLHDVILVGHSYGGMVVTGVADSIPSRIKHLIYLDAFVPYDGESVLSIKKKTGSRILFKDTDGFSVPTWVRVGTSPPSDVPHPYKTLTDQIPLDNPLREDVPTTYIHTVMKGRDPQNDSFAAHANRARQKGWPILILEADHNAQWSAPAELAKMLENIVYDK